MNKLDPNRLSEQNLLRLILEENERYRASIDQILMAAANMKYLLELQEQELKIANARRSIREVPRDG